MNDRKIKFRNAMGGYNKEDVNSYIEMLSTRYYEAEVDNQKRVTELEKRIKELEEENAKMNSVDSAATQEFKEKLEKTDSLIVELNGTIEKLNLEKEELTKENADLRASVSEYEKMTEASSEVYEKSTKYDKVSEQIGSMIVSASARAESIVSEAELKARITSKTMIDTTLEKLNAMSEKYTGEIMTKTVQLTEELRGLSLAAESFRANTKTAIENDCRELKESLESTKRVIMEGDNE